MEEVWKRQQDAAKEDQKTKDLQKQIAEERAKEEMYAVAEAAGVKVYVFSKFFIFLLLLIEVCGTFRRETFVFKSLLHGTLVIEPHVETN